MALTGQACPIFSGPIAAKFKPVSLYEYMIEESSPENPLVLRAHLHNYDMSTFCLLWCQHHNHLTPFHFRHGFDFGEFICFLTNPRQNIRT